MSDQAILSAVQISFGKTYMPKSLRSKMKVKFTKTGAELISKKNTAKKSA